MNSRTRAQEEQPVQFDAGSLSCRSQQVQGLQTRQVTAAGSPESSFRLRWPPSDANLRDNSRVAWIPAAAPAVPCNAPSASSSSGNAVTTPQQPSSGPMPSAGYRMRSDSPTLTARAGMNWSARTFLFDKRSMTPPPRPMQSPAAAHGSSDAARYRRDALSPVRHAAHQDGNGVAGGDLPWMRAGSPKDPVRLRGGRACSSSGIKAPHRASDRIEGLGSGESASSILRASLATEAPAAGGRPRPAQFQSGVSPWRGGSKSSSPRDPRSREPSSPELLQQPKHAAACSTPPSLGSRHTHAASASTLASLESQDPFLAASFGPSRSGSRGQLLGTDPSASIAGKLLFSEDLRKTSPPSPVGTARQVDKLLESPMSRSRSEAESSFFSTRGAFQAVFLLPNLKESDDFMQQVILAFTEDSPRLPETSVLQLKVGVGDPLEVLLQQLGPVDALEDVQRRARRAAASLLRRWALSWGREFGLELTGPRKAPVPVRRAGQKPRFAPASGLPKVDSEAAARSTVLVYFVRPFESAKDAERQLGPVCIVEASYHGASHIHVPRRLVVALEEVGSMSEWRKLENAREDGRPLGTFGAKVQERLRQRGVDLPVISVERGSTPSHHEVVARVVASLNVDEPLTRSIGHSMDALSPISGEKAPSSGRIAAGKALTQDLLARFVPCSEADPQHLQLQRLQQQQQQQKNQQLAEPLGRSPLQVSQNDLTRESLLAAGGSGEPGSAIPSWRWQETAAFVEEVAAISSLEVPSSGSRITSATLTGLSDHLSEPSPEPSPKPAAPKSAISTWLPSERGVQEPPGHMRRSGTVGAAPVDEVARTSPLAVAAKDEPPKRLAEAQADAMPLLWQNLNSADQKEAPPEIAHPEPGTTAIACPPSSQSSPLVQVGEAVFSLPAPGLAAKRVKELWRPGVAMVVITTEHFGTPLFCPNGDMNTGLVNLAPSSQGGKQLLPLYWRNTAEESTTTPPGGSSGGHHRQAHATRMLPKASLLPTMVEEEEEEEQEQEGD